MDVRTVGRRLATVQDRVAAAGGDPGRVQVLAVTKGMGAEAVAAATELGLEVGENYATELVEKAADPGLASGVAWHFLGAVQRRKVRDLAGIVASFDAVARVSEGEEIARRRPGARVLVQVDTTGAPQRNGVAPDGVAGVVEVLRTRELTVAGLMAVAPPDPEGARDCFRTVRRLADDLGLAERSMGMSDDLELAVAEGATTVRIGRALFGDRPVVPALTGASRRRSKKYDS